METKDLVEDENSSISFERLDDKRTKINVVRGTEQYETIIFHVSPEKLQILKKIRAEFISEIQRKDIAT